MLGVYERSRATAQVRREVVRSGALGVARPLLVHFHEVQETAARHAAHRIELDRRRQEYLERDPRIVPDRG
jgi:hypothetical protein